MIERVYTHAPRERNRINRRPWMCGHVWPAPTKAPRAPPGTGTGKDQANKDCYLAFAEGLDVLGRATERRVRKVRK